MPIDIEWFLRIKRALEARGSDMSDQPGLPIHETPPAGQTAPSVEPQETRDQMYDGPARLASFQAEDSMNLVLPRLTEIGTYVMNAGWDRTMRIYKQVQEANEANGGDLDELDELDTKLEDSFVRSATIVEKVVTIEALPAASTSLVGTVIDYASREFSFPQGRGLYLGRDPKTWARLSRESDLDYSIKLLPETEWGKRLLSPFATTEAGEVADFRYYNDGLFTRLLTCAIIFLLITFCAIPLVIVALDIGSLRTQAVTSLVWACVFCVLAPALFRDTTTVLSVGVAYVALLGTLLNQKDH